MSECLICVLLVDRRKQSVSVVQDEEEAPIVTGLALAHQLGHSLGMQDDSEDTDHACRCDAPACVMSRHFRFVCRLARFDSVSVQGHSSGSEDNHVISLHLAGRLLL